MDRQARVMHRGSAGTKIPIVLNMQPFNRGKRSDAEYVRFKLCSGMQLQCKVKFSYRLIYRAASFCPFDAIHERFILTRSRNLTYADCMFNYIASPREGRRPQTQTAYMMPVGTGQETYFKPFGDLIKLACHQVLDQLVDRKNQKLNILWRPIKI